MASQKEETLKEAGEVEGDSSPPMQSSTISKEKSAPPTTTLTLLRSQSVGGSSSTTTTTVPLQRSRSTTRRTKTRKTIYLLSRKQPNDTTKDKKPAKAKANDISFSSTYQKSKGESSLSSTKTSSISRKYKPKKFGDIAGNDITVTAISNAIEKKRVAPLYLFHGPRGTGKTSTARIFAMALNCESRSIAINKPCWSCTGCTRTLYIMDHLYSGSTQIAEFCKIQSVPGFKVLIIEDADAYDELELLSIVQQGSLYDSNVVFVLISGAVNDMPTSISSRCQKFGFPKLRDKDIAMKLEKITALEGMGIEREAIKLIVAKSEGSLREAENILDQLALLGSTITTSMVQQLVGLIPQNKLIDLLATAVSGETIKIVRVTKELVITGGVEPRALVSQLSSLITDILSGAVADSDLLSSKDKRLLRSRSCLADDNQTARLCSALKILVETERQLRSLSSTREDQTSGILAALIEIASQDTNFPRRSITQPSDDKPNAESSADIHSSTSRSRYTDGPAISASSTSQLTMEPGTTFKSLHKAQICRGKEAEKMPEWACMGDMEKIWQDMLEKIRSTSMKAFLSHQVRLASLSVSRANTIVHLMFKTPEDKRAAEVCEESISKALKIAIGCPGVTVNMSLEPVASSYLEEVKNTILLNQINPFSPQFGVGHSGSNTEDLVLLQSEGKALMPTKTELKVQHIERCASKGKETITTAKSTSRPECNTSAAEVSREILTRGRASIDVIDHNSSMRMMRSNNKPKHRWLSLSSIPHIDASVEPYSQDILFENANRDTQSNGRKNPKKAHNKGFSSKPPTEDHHYSQDTAIHAQVNDSWRCIDILRHRRQKHES